MLLSVIHICIWKFTSRLEYDGCCRLRPGATLAVERCLKAGLLRIATRKHLKGSFNLLCADLEGRLLRCPPLRACIVAARSTKRTLVQTHAHAQCSLARREPNCRGYGQCCHFWGCLRNGRAWQRQQQSALRRASARGGSSMCALQPRSPTHSSLVRVAPLDAPHEIVCLWVTMHHSARRQQGYSAAVPHGFGTVAGLLMLRRVTFRPC